MYLPHIFQIYTKSFDEENTHALTHFYQFDISLKYYSA